MLSHAIIICALVYILIRGNNYEGFQSEEVLNKQAKILYDNKNLFKPATPYTKIKKKIPWIDPVIYNDTFKVSQKKNCTVDDIKNVLYV